MPRAEKGWAENGQAMFKLEGQNRGDLNYGYGVVNTGLGKSEAIELFNERILKFEKMEK